MSWTRAWIRIKRALRGSVDEHDLEDEIRFHLSAETRLRTERGERPEEAERQARRAFGNVVQAKEATRAIWASSLAEQLLQDMRYAARTFARTRAFTTAAVLTLALGIGVTTAVFSVVDLLLFRDLPFANEDRLVSIGILYGTVDQEFLFGAQYAELMEELQSVEAWTSFSGTSGCDIAMDVPRRLTCARVEANFIPTMGLGLALGRNFTLEEDRRNGPRRALISYGFWQNAFAGERSVLGTTIPIDGNAHEIIGVLGPEFELPTLVPADIVVPQRIEHSFLPQLEGGPNPPLRVFGRLRPGVSLDAAEQELARLAEGVPVRVRLVRDRQIGGAKTAAWILLGVVGAVLLIVSANVANLMLVRTTNRRAELAVRAALGAGRSRIVRQLLLETVLLAAVGGAAGSGLAVLLLRVFVWIAPGGIPRLAEASVDWRVLAFAAALSLGAGLASGLASALSPVGPALLVGRSRGAAMRPSLTRTFVVAQIAVSLILLTGATLLVRSFWNLHQEPLWARADQVLTAEVSLAPAAYGESGDALSFFDELERRLKIIPGLGGLAISDSLPPAGEVRNVRMDIPGRDEPEFPVWRYVTPTYFDALGIPIIQGRTFLEDERTATSDLYVLSESLARRRYGSTNVVGEAFGDDGTVVGVVGDVQNQGLAAAADAEYYVLRKNPQLGQRPTGLPDFYRRAFLIVRTALDQTVAVDQIRNHIATMDPTAPVTFETFADRLRRETAPARFNGTLTGLFAVLAVVLAGVGLYGVTAFLVVRRTPEFGLRMAVGATRASNVALALSGAAKVTLTGIALGTLGSLMTARFLDSLLYEVPARDPWTLVASSGLLATISLISAGMAARHAARVDPIEALRHE